MPDLKSSAAAPIRSSEGDLEAIQYQRGRNHVRLRVVDLLAGRQPGSVLPWLETLLVATSNPKLSPGAYCTGLREEALRIRDGLATLMATPGEPRMGSFSGAS